MKAERITELRRKAVSGHCDYQYGRAVLIECLDDIERLMEGERVADKEIKRLRGIVKRFQVAEHDANALLMITRGKYSKPSEATSASYSLVIRDISLAQNNIDELLAERAKMQAELYRRQYIIDASISALNKGTPATAHSLLGRAAHGANTEQSETHKEMKAAEAKGNSDG